MYTRIIHINYGEQESKKQFSVYDSDIPATLKQGQGHQTWYELVDPKQGYNKTHFEKPHLNSVCESANDKGFAKSENASIISLECVCKSKIMI